MSDTLYAALARPAGATSETIDGNRIALELGAARAVPSLYAGISRPAEGIDGALTAVTRQAAETVDNDFDQAALLDRWGGRTWTTKPTGADRQRP